jgi:hypothetical protein
VPAGLRASILTTAACLIFATSGRAQTAAPAQSSFDDWRVAGGYGWFGLRDVARSHPPVDASPVAWHGTGPVLFAQRTRTRETRAHRYELSAAFDGNFEYRSPLESLARPDGDSYRSIEGRYEYRRYLFRDRFVRGLDVGVGIQGIGAFYGLSRHLPVNLEVDETGVRGGTSIVAAARVQRWSRTHLEVGWINGIAIGRVREHRPDVPDDLTRFAGGWLTDLVITADVRVARSAAITIRYVDTGDGLSASHRTYTTSHGSIAGGVTFAR